MEPAAIVNLLRHGTRLKQMPRTGWYQRGVPNPENVAAHSYGVALAALALSELIDQPFKLGQVLAMATLHDLAEAFTSDIPATVKQLFDDAGAKKQSIERKAFAQMTANVPFGGNWRELWEEMTAEESAEAKLVHDADKIDLYVQALTYQRQTGNTLLAQFWQSEPNFHFAESAEIYRFLKSRV